MSTPEQIMMNSHTKFADFCQKLADNGEVTTAAGLRLGLIKAIKDNKLKISDVPLELRTIQFVMDLARNN